MRAHLSIVFAAAISVTLSALSGCTAQLVDPDAKDQASSAGGGTSTGGAGVGGTTATGGAGVGGSASGGAATGGAGTGGAVCDLTNSGDSSLLAADTGEVLEPTFATLKAILESNYGCASSDCHAGTEHTPMQLILDDNLRTYLTTHVSEGCCNLKVVDPGYPERSAIVRVLKGTCGTVDQMPYGCAPGEFGSCLPVNYVQAIEQWIAAGAAP